MPEYARMCLNMPKSAGMDFFCFIFPIVITCLLKRVVIYWNFYTKLQAIVWSEHEAVFLARQNLISSLVAESVSFNFFRLNLFISKISNLPLPLGTKGLGPWILIYLRLRVEQLQNIEIKRTETIHKPFYLYHRNKVI